MIGISLTLLTLTLTPPTHAFIILPNPPLNSPPNVISIHIPKPCLLPPPCNVGLSMVGEEDGEERGKDGEEEEGEGEEGDIGDVR